MVSRLKVNNPQPFVVVDLDGTLINGNSMTMFVMYSFRLLVMRGRLGDAWRVAKAVFKRKTGQVSHREMKYCIMSVLYKALSGEDICNFAQLLAGKVNRVVMHIISDALSCGQKVILATAAPDIYISELAGVLGIDHFTATKMTDNVDSYEENRGEIKKKRVVELVGSLDGYLETVITDHLDDIPLLSYCNGTNLIVSPDAATLLALKKNGIKYNLI